MKPFFVRNYSRRKSTIRRFLYVALIMASGMTGGFPYSAAQEKDVDDKALENLDMFNVLGSPGTSSSTSSTPTSSSAPVPLSPSPAISPSPAGTTSSPVSPPPPSALPSIAVPTEEKKQEAVEKKDAVTPKPAPYGVKVESLPMIQGQPGPSMPDVNIEKMKQETPPLEALSTTKENTPVVPPSVPEFPPLKDTANTGEKEGAVPVTPTPAVDAAVPVPSVVPGAPLAPGEAVTEVTVDTAEEKERKAYEELWGHLHNFIGLQGSTRKEQPENTAGAIAGETGKEMPAPSLPQELPADDLFPVAPLGLDTALPVPPATSDMLQGTVPPLPGKAVTDDDALKKQVLASIFAKNPALSQVEIEAFAKDCLVLPAKLEQCVPFSCMLPATTADTHKQGQVFVIEGIKNNVCQVKSGDSTVCQLTPPSQKIFAAVLEGRFAIKAMGDVLQDAPAGIAPEQIAAWQQVLKECNNTEKAPAIAVADNNKGQGLATEVPAAKEEKGPSAKGKAVEEQETQPGPGKKAISAAMIDKLVKEQEQEDMLGEESKQLPEDKQLSRESKDTLHDLAQALSPGPDGDDDAEGKDGISLNKAEKLVIKGHGKEEEEEEEEEVASDSMDLSVKQPAKAHAGRVEDKEELAYKALLTEQVEAAIALYREILDENYDNKTALFGLATAYHRNHQEKQARDVYIQLLRIDPGHQEAMNNFLVLVADEAPENALLELKKLESINPASAMISAQIAMTHVKLKNYPEAERAFRKALSLDPQNTSYIYNLAIVSDHLNKKAQAIAFYTQLVKAEKYGAIIPGTIEHIKQRLEYLEATP